MLTYWLWLAAIPAQFKTSLLNHPELVTQMSIRKLSSLCPWLRQPSRGFPYHGLPTVTPFWVNKMSGNCCLRFLAWQKNWQ